MNVSYFAIEDWSSNKELLLVIPRFDIGANLIIIRIFCLPRCSSQLLDTCQCYQSPLSGFNFNNVSQLWTNYLTKYKTVTSNVSGCQSSTKRAFIPTSEPVSRLQEEKLLNLQMRSIIFRSYLYLASRRHRQRSFLFFIEVREEGRKQLEIYRRKAGREWSLAL